LITSLAWTGWEANNSLFVYYPYALKLLVTREGFKRLVRKCLIVVTDVDVVDVRPPIHARSRLRPGLNVINTLAPSLLQPKVVIKLL